jgi:hypothetical protein
MSEGERRAGGVQAAAYERPLATPPDALEALFREHHGAVHASGNRELKGRLRRAMSSLSPRQAWPYPWCVLGVSSAGALTWGCRRGLRP